jgi:hypothetical protein
MENFETLTRSEGGRGSCNAQVDLALRKSFTLTAMVQSAKPLNSF